MKKSIKYAGIAAATLLAVAPVAAPVVSQAATENTTGDSDVNPATDKNVTVKYVKGDAKGNAVGTDGKDLTADQLKDSTNFVTVGSTLNYSSAKADADGFNDLDRNFDSNDWSLADTPVTYSFSDATPSAPSAKPVATLANKNTQLKVADNGTLYVVLTSDTKPTSTQQDVNKAIDKFGSQFADRDANDVLAAQSDWSTIALGENNQTTTKAFNNANKGFIDSDKNGQFDALNDRSAQVFFTATDAKGNTYNGQTGSYRDLQKAVNDKTKTPIKVTVMYRYRALKDNTWTAWTKLTTFNINSSTTDEMTEVNAKFTNPMNVALNSQVVNTQYVNNSNVEVNDQNGDSLATSNINLSGTYFYTFAQAMDAATAAGVAGADGVDAAAVNGVASQDDVDTSNGGEFKTAGTYYQVISYTAKSGQDLNTFINKYIGDPTSYAIYVNGKKASAGYDFNTATSTTGDTTTLSFVRTINVSNSTSEWTESAADGIVTTKNDTPYYTLKNNDNDRIKNRALAKNTAWKTDKVRSDQFGNKQYRVATGEWIDASDVTFGDTPSIDNSGALTDIQSVKGVVKLDNAGFTYFLYNKAGDQLKTRALSGNSAWQVINTAKDAEGNTYYRVATDEWVMQGNGVTFN